jgi:chorismate mutase
MRTVKRRFFYASEKAMTERLETIREEIDLIDEQVMELLNRRIGLALETAKEKTTTRDLDREEAITARLERIRTPNLSNEFKRDLYECIFRYSRIVQDRGK